MWKKICSSGDKYDGRCVSLKPAAKQNNQSSRICRQFAAAAAAAALRGDDASTLFSTI